MSLEMSSKGISIFGKCSCGHEEKFKGSDYQINKYNPNNFRLVHPFICPSCKVEHYDLEIPAPEYVESKRTVQKYWSKLIIPLLSVAIITFLYFGISYLHDKGEPKDDFYNTGDPSDMTEEDYNNFIKWKEEN